MVFERHDPAPPIDRRRAVGAIAAGLIACRARDALTIAINAGVEGDALQFAAREWAGERGLNVETVTLPYANLYEKEMLDLTSGTGAYDVIMIDDPWFPGVARNSQLVDLGDRARGDFIESCVAACRYPYATGPLYGLPYVGNSQLFFYRQDLFEKHRLPRPDTWDAVLHAARVITREEKIYGYVMRAATGNPVVTDFMPLMWAFGGEMFDDAGEPAIDSEGARAALRTMLELGRYSPPGYAGFNADELGAHLMQGTAAMSIKWPAWIGAMDDPNRSRVAGKIAFATMPSARRPGRPSLGAWMLAVPAASRKRDLAIEFIVLACAPERMKQAAIRGNPPTRRGVFLDPDLRRRFRGFPAQLASLEAARPRPRTPHWNEIENAFGIALSQANAGSLSADAALRRAQEEIRVILYRNK
ncbi:MAG: extracellular solute-binding protein [Bryobacteraceae bacterium]